MLKTTSIIDFSKSKSPRWDLVRELWRKLRTIRSQIVGLIAMGAMTGLYYFGSDAARQLEWDRGECQVQSVNTIPNPNDSEELRLEFHVTVTAATQDVSAIIFVPSETGFIKQAEAERERQEFSAGTTHSCYHNPSDPKEARFRTNHWGTLVVLALGLSVMLLLFSHLLLSLRSGRSLIRSILFSHGDRSHQPLLIQHVMEVRSHSKWTKYSLCMAMAAVVTIAFVEALPTKYTESLVMGWKGAECRIISIGSSGPAPKDPSWVIFEYAADGKTYRSSDYYYAASKAYQRKGFSNYIAAHHDGESVPCRFDPDFPPAVSLQMKHEPVDFTDQLKRLLILAIFLLFAVWMERYTLKKSEIVGLVSPEVSASSKYLFLTAESALATKSAPQTLSLSDLRLHPTAVFDCISRSALGLVPAIAAAWMGVFGTFPLMVKVIAGLLGLFGVAVTKKSFNSLIQRQSAARKGFNGLQIQLSPGVLRRGEPARVSWTTLRGNRVVRMMLALECVERSALSVNALAPAMNNPSAEIKNERRNSFFIREHAAEVGKLNEGHAVFELPKDVPHSFRTDHYEVSWIFRIRAELQDGTHKEESFPLVVLPLSAEAKS